MKTETEERARSFCIIENHAVELSRLDYEYVDRTAAIAIERADRDTMDKALRFCKHHGCNNLTTSGYCEEHEGDITQQAREADKRRGSSRDRGYTTRWSKYSKTFISRPENRFCKLHLDDGCNVLAQCVDHIDPPDDSQDKRFWDKSNHQAACIHCNSVKGHRKIVGTYEYGEQEHRNKG